MSKPHTLYGWELSLYSGKVRAYLRYKGIPFIEKPVRAWTLGTIQKKTGAQVMPVVVTPGGEWLQDSSDIIDTLEHRHPAAPVIPAASRQRVAAYLLEAWGDEFWLPSAMHYRWNFAENFTTLFEREGGDALLPFGPRWLKNRLIGTGASKMRSYLPGLGVIPEQAGTIEHWTTHMLDALDRHFAQLPYLLGTRPSIGDFGLIGPLYAHLGRDPYPLRTLIAPRPHLAAWVQRMQHPGRPRSGDFLPHDAIPDTLQPIFESIAREFWPQLVATLDEVHKILPKLAPDRGFPRQLGPISIPLAGARLRLNARPFSLWMAQRPLDAYHALPPLAQGRVWEWLRDWGQDAILDLNIRPRLQRRALHVAPEPV